MLLFRSEEHVDRWCAAWGATRGATLSPERAWRLARSWFARDRRSPEWRRHSPEEAEALFASLGLVGAFWRLG